MLLIGQPQSMTGAANQIWNRANFGGDAPLRRGDRALAGLLRLHNRAMNGGVLHALELSVAEFAVALDGYRYFGFDQAVAVLDETRARFEAGLTADEAEALESASDESYAVVIFSAFAGRLATHPDDFLPIEQSKSGIS
jgi:hypothetical protein